MNEPTIFALSSGTARAGVSVFRLSGVKVTAILKKICRKEPFRPRELILTGIHNPHSGTLIDRGLAVFFPGPASFTGEDVAELHVHGSRAVVREVESVLASIPEVRPADPGEFTRRAFENGKMDLTEVEGLADLIDAETEAQKSQALRQMSGELGARYEDWRHRLVGRLAYVEADIDFADEDLPEGILGHVWPDISKIAEDIRGHLADGHRGERLRDGYRIVILGPTNVGKSSLINALAKRDVAIVSEEAGTTRDVLEVHLDLAGFPVTVMDTAGLREGAGAVEAEGIRRALDRAAAADLTLRVKDARDFEDKEAAQAPGELTLWNKSDLVTPATVTRIRECDGSYPLSIKEEFGLSDILDAIESRVTDELSHSEGAAITRLRHRKGLEVCLYHLEAFDGLRQQGQDGDLELAAEELRLAARALGRITGRVDVEDILDVIFQDFCIGK